MWVQSGCRLWLCLPAFWRVCWCGSASSLCYFADVSKIVLMLLLFGALPAFCPLCCFACGVLHLNMALFRVFRAFLEGFLGFVWVCVIWALCVACVGFCAREVFGGLEAYCVFASILSLSHPFFIFFAYLLGLCLCCPRLVLLPALFVLVSLWVFVFFFSLSDYTQKERARRFIPCVLSSCVVGCFIWLRLYIPHIRQVSARLYRNKVLEKGNRIECSKLFCARLCSCLCSSRFVFLLFSYLVRLVGSCFLSPFRLLFGFNP